MFLSRRHLSLSLFVALATATLAGACEVGSAGGGGGGGGADAAPPVEGEISGDITEDATWTGAVTLAADATIMAGVSIAIAPGTELVAMDGAQIRVLGSLTVAGTAEQKVTMNPASGTWAGIVVESGGEASLSHVIGANVATLLYCHLGSISCALDSVELTDFGSVITTHTVSSISNSRLVGMANGGVRVNSGGDLTITDSYLLTSDHDLIVTGSGSRLTLDHVEIGEAQGSYEHCDIHVGAADSVTITNSNIRSGIYGIMLGNTDGAVMSNNNFTENGVDQDISPVGPNTNVDLRNNYWDQGAPQLGADYDTSSPAATPFAEAGPRR